MRATTATHGPGSVAIHIAVASIVASIVLLAAPARAAEAPEPVSPGASRPGAITELRCPTFSWAGVAGAAGYELAVFRVASTDRASSHHSSSHDPGGGDNETADIHLKGRPEVLPVSRNFLHLFRQM